MPTKFSSTTAAASRAPAGQAAPEAPSAGGGQPLKRFRFGRISASIWENPSENGPNYTVQFQRAYMDEAKNFQYSDRFYREDLPLVAKVADLAHTFIYERMATTKSARD
jgi:hypothetical protein